MIVIFINNSNYIFEITIQLVIKFLIIDKSLDKLSFKKGTFKNANRVIND